MLVNAIDDEVYNNFVWIGINDQMEEGQYVYTKSDEPILFENWAAGNPSGQTLKNCIGHHTYLSDTMEGKWIDFPCYRELRFICEKYLG